MFEKVDFCDKIRGLVSGATMKSCKDSVKTETRKIQVVFQLKPLVKFIRIYHLLHLEIL